MEKLIEVEFAPLAAAGTDERIRDRLASWGFELEPAEGVAGDMGLVEARAKPPVEFAPVVGESVATLGRSKGVYREMAEVVESGALEAEDWYLFADPPRDGLGALWPPMYQAELRLAGAVPYSWDFTGRLSFTISLAFAPSYGGGDFEVPPAGAWEPVGAWQGY